MSIAQKLYEGIDLGNETVGLISYMRTDSVRLSDEFTKATYNYICDNYGKEYAGHVKISKKTDNVQDAHEAIRPTSILREPLKIKEHLSSDEFKLYSLIYKRALASLMADAKVNQTTVVLNNNDYKFKTTGSVLVFDGYLKVYADYEDRDDKILPQLSENDLLTTDNINSEQHFTKPPSRYTEAKLIKEMEELGIGRPSTYAKIMDTIRSRDYVVMEDKKFKPTEVGIETTDKLQEFFSDLINVEYTKEMEEDLDEIAEGKLVWNNVLDKFWQVFEPRVESAFTDMEKKAPEETGEICPECGNPLVIRKGRYGEFTACSNYPECKYIKKEEKKIVEIMDCPKCNGKIIEKNTRRGKIFYGCNNYPKCDVAFWDKPIGKKCPEWAKDVYQEFIDLKKNEGFKNSTISMFEVCIKNFLVYLDLTGISSYDEITPGIIHAFNRDDKNHKTNYSKNAYNTRVRNYLKYLELHEITSMPGLSYALEKTSSSGERIVEILDPDDEKTILEFCHSAKSPMDLRDSAIVLLGLLMGLRASDVANLDMYNIDFKNRLITFVQLKTQTEVCLPMPITVGNAIFRYLVEGRKRGFNTTKLPIRCKCKDAKA